MKFLMTVQMLGEVSTVKTSFLIFVLFATCAAQTQSLKLVAVHFAANGSTPDAIQLLCSQKYDRAECVKDATTLRQEIAPHPVQLLGAWSFVLVPADDWKALVRGQGGDPVSPAFSMLDQRVTLLDGSLFVTSASPHRELMQRFDTIGPALVDLAVTHEMGHGICQEKDERRADDYGRQLRGGQTPACSRGTKSATNEVTASVASVPAQPISTADPNRSLPPQHFECGTGITLETCRQEMSVLRKVLAKYGSSDLGEWKWVLVRSENWKLFLISRGLNPRVPALTALKARTTFIEEALFAGPSGRVSELMDIWHADRDGLLDLAVRHELGHALCTEENEQQADRIARLLEQKKPFACKGNADARQKSNPHASLN
jgi:hypothetical protein